MIRPVRPTSYVTRLPSRESWREILARYRAGKPTLGEVGRCRGGGVSEHAVTGAPTTGARQRRLR